MPILLYTHDKRNPASEESVPFIFRSELVNCQLIHGSFIIKTTIEVFLKECKGTFYSLKTLHEMMIESQKNDDEHPHNHSHQAGSGFQSLWSNNGSR